MFLGPSKSAWILLIFALQYFTIMPAEDSVINERLINELQIDDQEMIEWFENVTHTKRNAYNMKHFGDLSAAEEYYGEVFKLHVETLKDHTNYVPDDLERNMTLMLQPGDWLLPAESLSKLIRYKNYIEELKTTVKIPCPNHTKDCFFSEEDYQNTLRNSRNLKDLKSSWGTWQNIYIDSNVIEYGSHLEYVKVAAKLNGFNDVRNYWQFLVDYTDENNDAFDKAEEIWEEIEPFYRKFHKFVRNRLKQFYKVNETWERIPIYLLGDKFGSDWIEIADLILPHPQLHYDVNSYLKNKDVQDIYRYSEEFTKNLSLGKFGKEFWKSSKFNSSVCGPKIFEYPDSKYTSIQECNQPSWTTFLDAHEVGMVVVLNNLDYSSLPRQRLRFSAMDDAISTLGSILAIETLEDHEIIPNGKLKNASKGDPDKMTKLLIMALRIFPRLPYYLAVDNFRLKQIEKNGLKMSEITDQLDENYLKNINISAADFTQDWWRERRHFQGVRGISDSEADFLNDAQFLTNTPFLNKFYGVIIAFQLYDYYNGYLEEGGNIIEAIGKDDVFRKVVHERSTTDWISSLSIRYGLDITASSLLNYFQPLEEYFDKAPKEQVPLVTTTTTTTTVKSVTEKIDDTQLDGPNNKEAVGKAQGTNEDLVKNQEEMNLRSQNSADIIGPRSGNLPEDDAKSDNIRDSEDNNEHVIPMWAGISLLILVACTLVAVFIARVIIRRKRSLANRRFSQ